FTDHVDPDLIEAVRTGRREEFRAFQWKGKLPDPQDSGTFFQCKLKWKKKEKRDSRALLDFYRQLLQLRKNIPALCHLSKEDLEVRKVEDRLLLVRRWHEESHVCSVMNFSSQEIAYHIDLGPGRWRKVIDSSEKRWMGTGSLMPGWYVSGRSVAMNALSFVLYEKERME
ncbi:MAG: DUF3459 domain-containing protein, partial [Desulfatiglandales bacterium]